ncbi:MAG TPA: M3 family metallopeptidase [Holophagaceae bacterium]
MPSIRPVPLPLAWALTACAFAFAGTPPGAPFMKPSPLPFQAPPFDRIQDSDFLPALEAGMKAHLAEVAKVAANPAAPTFENTIVALERSGAELTRVKKVFFHLTSANTNPGLQKIQEEVAPKLAAHDDEIYLNAKLFQRIKAIHAQRAHLKLGAEGQELVERYYQTFVHAGAELSAADQTKLRALNQEESKLTTDFRNRLLAATKDGALVLDREADLKGLSKGEIEAAAAAAKARGLEGKFVLTLQNTTQQPALASLEDRSVRERLFKASVDRASLGNADDTRAIELRLAQLRAQKAALFGCKDFATYAMYDQMAKTPEAAEKLMTSLVPAATAKARAEAAKMQALIDHQGGGFQLAPWDWEYYAEQVRKAEYDLDEAQIKPYFELDRVLQDGVFYAANRLYGLTFKERKDIPVYQPDVRVFEVFDADKKPLALFYADYFKRDNKSGGAWMDSFVDQSGLLKTKPAVYNVCNFSKPAAGQPALLSFDDVSTMFHEFGHALHGMLSNVKYPLLAGTNVPRDFVEFPSQFNENWALQPQVFAHYAKDYRTGKPMPEALVQKIRKARTFNQGYALTEYLASALLDMAWHTQPATEQVKDVQAFEDQALKGFHLDLPQVPPRYHTPYFAHIWTGDYAAGYYAYLWSEVLDHDAYAWFKAHGDLTRANGDRFRKMILSRGSTEDMAKLYRAFRGQDPSVEPLEVARGLKEAPAK